jgi:hypothetical protein
MYQKLLNSEIGEIHFMEILDMHAIKSIYGLCQVMDGAINNLLRRPNVIKIQKKDGRFDLKLVERD